MQPRQLLNKYLASRDISPVRSALLTPWDEASERTKRHYKGEAKQVVDATLEEIAPQDHDHLFRSVSQSYASSTMNLDSTWMEAIKECYANADHWSTRRQILSVVADKMSMRGNTGIPKSLSLPLKVPSPQRNACYAGCTWL